MNHARTVVSGCLESAWGWSGRGVEGGSEHFGIRGRRCVPRLQVEDTRGRVLDGGTQEHRLVNGQRERGTLDQARQPIIVAYLG